MLRILFFEAINPTLRESSHFLVAGEVIYGTHLHHVLAKSSSWINAHHSCLEMLSPDPALCVWTHRLCSRDSFWSPESPSSA